LVAVVPKGIRLVRCLFSTITLSRNFSWVKISHPDVIKLVPFIITLLLESFLFLDVGVVVAAISCSTVDNDSYKFVLVVFSWLFESL
jgi:hypothetical protein